MNRWVSATVVLALVAGGCTGGDDGGADGGAGSAGGRSRTTTSAPVAANPGRPECTGIGEVPAGGEVTVVRRDGLYAVGLESGTERCLVPAAPTGAGAQWAPTGNRVLFADKVWHSSGREPTPSPPASVRWSRPRGSSLVATAGSPLRKWPSEGGDPVDIDVEARLVDAVAYHPAGRHIAFAGEVRGYGIYIATNEGRAPRLVTRGETVAKIHEIEFSHDGKRLYFVADHGEEDHVHRLDLETGALETLGRGQPVTSLVVSPIGGVAWYAGPACEGRSHVVRRGAEVELPAEVRAGRVVGWLPGDLVVLERERACGVVDSKVAMVWEPGAAVRDVAHDAAGVQVRFAFPDPPGPPPREVFDLPESAAPA